MKNDTLQAVGFLIAVLCGLVVLFSSFETTATATAPKLRETPPFVAKPLASLNLSIETIKWSKGGFGTVAILDRITLKNHGYQIITDPIIECKFVALSGTVLAMRSMTMYVKIKPGQKETLRHINAGFINQQTNGVSCKVIH